MDSRNAMVQHFTGRGRTIAVHELMPPEQFYRPSRSMDGSLTASFLFVSATMFAVMSVSSSMLPVFALMAFFFARTLSRRASHGAAVEQNQAAVNLLNAGRVDDAAKIFERLTKTERRTPAHAVYVFNRAVAFMLQGRPRRAYSLFNAVLRSHAFHLGYSHSYLPLLHIEVGTCLALMGEVDEATKQREEASRRLSDRERPRLAFIDALILARSGRYAAALEAVENSADAVESLLRRPTLQALVAIKAFSLVQLQQTSQSRALSLLREAEVARGELDWMAVSWPEFRAFLSGL